MDKEALKDLRFEMSCLDWWPVWYSDDDLLSAMWCKFSQEMYCANELIITEKYVRDFNKWVYDDTHLGANV